EIVAEQLAELAAALADLTQHDHVGGRAARDLAEQCRLADARRRKQPDALAASEREQRIDDAYSGRLWCADRRPCERGRRGAIDGPALAAKRRPAVDRHPETVEDATEHVVAACDGRCLAGP